MPKQPIYQFYCRLQEADILTYRIIQVPKSKTLAQLGYILMTAFEMEASHLYEFVQYTPDGNQRRNGLGARRYVADFDDDEYAPIPADKAGDYRISRIFDEYCGRVEFRYDFGDGWVVSVSLDEILFNQPLPASDYPRVIAGAGWGIVEDVGGVGGLQRLQEAFDEHRGDEYAEYSRWLGVADFDLHDFDLDEMNRRLKKIPSVYRKVYEANQQPSEAMIRYIQRI